MKVRNRSMTGAVHGVWMMPGDVVDIADDYAKELIKLGYVESVEGEKVARVEHAVAPEVEVETADVDTSVMKRGPGRPRKDDPKP